MDQFVATHPDYLFESSPEEARLDPTNLHVLLAHVRSAAFELPFDSGDSLSGVPTDDLLYFLSEEGHVRLADDNRWYWASENFPASEVSLRVGAPGERGDHRHDRSSATGCDRRDRPVCGAGSRLRQRHLSARVAPVPRRAPRLGGAARVREAGRCRLLHAGAARGDPQATREVRRPHLRAWRSASTAR